MLWPTDYVWNWIVSPETPGATTYAPGNPGTAPRPGYVPGIAGPVDPAGPAPSGPGIGTVLTPGGLPDAFDLYTDNYTDALQEEAAAVGGAVGSIIKTGTDAATTALGAALKPNTLLIGGIIAAVGIWYFWPLLAGQALKARRNF